MIEFLEDFPILEKKYVEDNNTLHITLSIKNSEIGQQIKEKIWKKYKTLNIKIEYV